MNAIGLKYVGKREEGISVMLFRSYKTIRVNKLQPYRFTPRDIVNAESINYYNRLANLGLAIVTSEDDFKVSSKSRFAVRKEPLAAEVDVQIDPTQAPKTVEDKMSDDLTKNETAPTTSEENSDQLDTTDSDEEVEISASTNESEELSVDKSDIRAMSIEEISEYLEMNFNKDQIKSLISDLGLDISIGRKGVPALIGEIVAATELDSLINYLSK